MLLVCPKASPELDHSPAGLDAELAQLEAVQKAVKTYGFSHVFMYTSQMCTDMQRRSLMQANPPNPRRRFPPPPPMKSAGYYGFGPYKACGQLCQVCASMHA